MAKKVIKKKRNTKNTKKKTASLKKRRKITSSKNKKSKTSKSSKVKTLKSPKKKSLKSSTASKKKKKKTINKKKKTSKTRETKKKKSISKKIKTPKIKAKKLQAKKTSPPKKVSSEIKPEVTLKKKRGRKPKKHLSHLLALSKRKGASESEVILTDAEGRRYCRVSDCDQMASVLDHCRFHYLLFWKKIQIKKEILSEGKLKKYIDEIASQYPDKLLQLIQNDLKDQKKFLQAIQELGLDESESEQKPKKKSQTFMDESPNYTPDENNDSYINDSSF